VRAPTIRSAIGWVEWVRDALILGEIPMKQRIEDGYNAFFEPAEAMSTVWRAAVQIEPDPP
jgi:hypothetical protein